MRNYLPLIVEDEESAIYVLKDVLSQLPFLETPLVSRTATQALGILKQTAVDVLFL